MTTGQLLEKLKAEFPGEYVCLTAEYSVYADGKLEAELRLYIGKTNSHDYMTVAALDLDDAISRLRACMNGGPMPAFDDGPLVPMSATISETPLVKVGQGTSETTIMPSDVLGEGGAV